MQSKIRSRSFSSSSSCSSAFEDSENEDPSDYRIGGYHPVQIGDILGEKYQILAKLGWGYFSTVWLGQLVNPETTTFESCQVVESSSSHANNNNNNLQSSTKQEFAIKIVKSDSKYTEAAMDEIKLCNEVVRCWNLRRCHRCQTKIAANQSEECCVVQLKDSFRIQGPNGEHVCLVFEPLHDNLLTVLQRQNYSGLEIPIVEKITKQILLGLHLLHAECQIIHTDLKPENVLLAADAAGEGENWKVKIVDLGNACWKDHHFTDDIQTRQYRSPEVILGCEYDEKVDIWSVGCIVFELLTGDVLFQPKSSSSSSKSFSKEDDHIAQIMELLGPIPERLRLNGAFSDEIFTKRGKLRNIREKDLDFWPLKDVLREKYRFSSREAAEIEAFLLPLLQIEPNRRSSALEALSSQWLANVQI